MDRYTLLAFADELDKIAEAKEVHTVEEMKKVLKPGDVLATAPRLSFLASRSKKEMAFRPITVSVQHTPYTHVGMYVGDDKVMETWNQGVVERSVGRYMGQFNIKVLRVRAQEAEKKNAVKFMKAQLGKSSDDVGMVKTLLPSPVQKGHRTREDKDKWFCSQLISNAYPKQPFGPGKIADRITPGDIQRSAAVKTVATFKAKEDVSDVVAGLFSPPRD